MKVGTDGVLLGAWTPLNNQPNRILDIGAGTGIIALMLAQRSEAATIDALEIEEGAYEQCVENFEGSPWADRLFCYHAGLDELVEEMEDPYELIVSNPPFYAEAISSGDRSRDMARQRRSLPFDELLSGTSKLLAATGIFAVIIPYTEEASFISMAQETGLTVFQITRVKGTPGSVLKRSLLAFSFEKRELREDELVIETDRHQYTEAYTALTRNFYLKM